jgi:hypothetical protein
MHTTRRHSCVGDEVAGVAVLGVDVAAGDEVVDVGEVLPEVAVSDAATPEEEVPAPEVAEGEALGDGL